VTTRGLVRRGLFGSDMVVGGRCHEDMAEKMLSVFAFSVTCPVDRKQRHAGCRFAVGITEPAATGGELGFKQVP